MFMVSLDTGSGQGTPRVYECEQCDTTLVSSKELDEIRCCDEPMAPLKGDQGLLNDPDIQVILKEVFGLSHNAIVICIVVIERGPITIDEIADIVELSSTTVSNVLDHLVDAGILENFEKNLKSGGTVNLYKAVSLETQQQIYRRGLYQWLGKSIEKINEFEIEALKAKYRSEEPVPRGKGDQASIYWETETGSASSD